MVRARVYLYAAAADGRWTDGNTHRRLLTRGIIAFGGGTLCQSSVLRQVNVAVHLSACSHSVHRRCVDVYIACIEWQDAPHKKQTSPPATASK